MSDVTELVEPFLRPENDSDSRLPFLGIPDVDPDIFADAYRVLDPFDEGDVPKCGCFWTPLRFDLVGPSPFSARTPNSSIDAVASGEGSLADAEATIPLLKLTLCLRLLPTVEDVDPLSPGEVTVEPLLWILGILVGVSFVNEELDVFNEGGGMSLASLASLAEDVDTPSTEGDPAMVGN